MEAASSGISSLIATTKTKLIVLSSLLGVGAIFYLTKNYIQKGQFLPIWSSKRSVLKKSKYPTIIGGKRHVVIKEDGNPTAPTRGLLKRQRSRRSSRRSSISSVKKRLGHKVDIEEVSLTQAISELDRSVIEVEEILGLKSATQNRMDSKNVKIENEINRLHQLLEIAQDINLAKEKTNNYIYTQNEVAEDIVEIEKTNDLDTANYNEIVESIRNQKTFESDSEYDSDLDSFISATESIDLEDGEETPEEILAFQNTLKVLITKHSKEDFYMHGIEYLTQYGVPVRSVRTKLIDCDNDIDFCVKVHCIRRAFKNLLKNDENREWFLNSGKEMLMSLLKNANNNFEQFSVDFDEMVHYCQDIDNWGDIDEELSSRGVCSMNFYDIILDFMIMDSFEDLSNPPSAITTVLQNRWLSLRIKETALSTAIWTVIKAKKRNLQNQTGFFSRFYDITMHLTPLLAWGFLGPVKELNDLCGNFKNVVIGFLKDIFSTEEANYKSIETLSEDIMRLARKRKEELFTLLS